MNYESETVSREALYELVWTEPVSSLSKRFGLSGAGFSKLCRRIGVPMPARGHWARIRAGHSVSRPPLGSTPVGRPSNVRLLALDESSQEKLLDLKRQAVAARKLASSLGSLPATCQQAPGKQEGGERHELPSTMGKLVGIEQAQRLEDPTHGHHHSICRGSITADGRHGKHKRCCPPSGPPEVTFECCGNPMGTTFVGAELSIASIMPLTKSGSRSRNVSARKFYLWGVYQAGKLTREAYAFTGRSPSFRGKPMTLKTDAEFVDSLTPHQSEYFLSRELSIQQRLQSALRELSRGLGTGSALSGEALGLTVSQQFQS